MNFVKVPQTLLTFSTTMLTPINTFAQTMMHTINGKLIIVNASELDEVKQLVEEIDRKCDRLETQRAIAPSLPESESVQFDQCDVSRCILKNRLTLSVPCIGSY